MLRVLCEAEILSKVDHPFLASLWGTISTPTHLHFLMEPCTGGELYAVLNSQPGKRFSEETMRFYAAEVSPGPPAQALDSEPNTLYPSHHPNDQPARWVGGCCMQCCWRLVSWSNFSRSTVLVGFGHGRSGHPAPWLLSCLPALPLSPMRPAVAGAACPGVPALPGLHLPGPEGEMHGSTWAKSVALRIQCWLLTDHCSGVRTHCGQACRHGLKGLASWHGPCHVS